MKTGDLAEVINNFQEDKVINYNNPSCNNCSECCGILTVISEEEYKFYVKYFKNNKEGKKIFEQAMKNWSKLSEKYDINLLCPFLTKKKKCMIYRIRPLTCKEFHCDPELNKVNKEELDRRATDNFYTIKTVVSTIIKKKKSEEF